METVQHWLSSVPPGLMYLIVASVIGVESMGIPVPGEIALVAASLLAVSGYADIWWVAVAGSLGAIIGDSIGYWVGHRGGRPFLERLGRRFPRHMGPVQLAKAERTFQRWGCGPSSSAASSRCCAFSPGRSLEHCACRTGSSWSRMSSGGSIWAGGTTAVIYYIGKVAESWLSRFSWIALAVAIVAGIVTTLIIRRRARREFAEAIDDSEQAGAEAEAAASGRGGPAT